MMRLRPLLYVAIWVLAGVVSAQQYAPAAIIFHGHKGYSGGAAFSDGRNMLALIGREGIWLYDRDSLETIKLLKIPEKLAPPFKNIVAAALSADGTLAAGGSVYGSILIWDVESGRLLHALEGHTESVSVAAFSPDGGTLAASSDFENTIRLWDPLTGQLKKTIGAEISGDKSLVYSPDGQTLAYSPDGRTLASGSWNDAIQLWDAETGDLKKTLTGHTGTVSCLAYSPDGQTLASGSWDYTVRLWDAETGEPRSTVLEGHLEIVESVAYSPDGKILAAGAGRAVRLWNAETGQLKKTLVGTMRLEKVLFSLNGKSLAVEGRHEILIWNLETGAEIVPMEGHTDAVASLAFSKDGATVLTGSHDKTIRLWSAETGEAIRTLKGHTEAVNSAAFSNDGKHVLSGGHDNAVRLWNAETGELIRTLEGHTAPALSVAFSPDGRTAASAGHDKTIRLWNVETGEALHMLGGHTDWITSVAFSPDGKTVLSGGLDTTIRIWDAQTGEPIRADRPYFEIFSVGYVQKSGMFASGGSQILLYLDGRRGNMIESHMQGDDHMNSDALTGEWVPIGISNADFYENWYHAFAVSPDGKTVAAGARDSLVVLIDASTRKNRMFFGGFSSPVKSLAYSPDGRRLAGGAKDGSAMIWRLPTTAQEIE